MRMLIFIIQIAFYPTIISNPGTRDEGYIHSRCNAQRCPARFACNCRNISTQISVLPDEEQCIANSWVCDGIPDCKSGSDELDCFCSKDEFQCSPCKPGVDLVCNFPLYECVPNSKVNDGKNDCTTGGDEPLQPIRPSVCRKSMYCNGFIECDWMTPNDEANCAECQKVRPKRCLCNQKGNFTCKRNDATRSARTCYREQMICDGIAQCTDATDEMNCTCEEDEYTCDCITRNECLKGQGCIKKSDVANKFKSCPNENVFFGRFGKIVLYRLNSVSECNNIGLPHCDNSTCYESNYTTCVDDNCSMFHVMCTSFYSDNNISQSTFQCADNRLILLSQFCDGFVDCIDGSDEIENQPGFKCGRCVLPQSNLYDNKAHCDDETDLCLENTSSCFQCLDKRLVIYSKQVCDGVNNCYDMSDECLCWEYFYDDKCISLFEAITSGCLVQTNVASQHISNANTTDKRLRTRTDRIIQCPTKHGLIYANMCDGRPECKDYRDECNCSKQPNFCNDTCHSFFLMGDRYCDGVEDQAWIYINDSSCSKGFDEKWCSQRYKCNSKGKVSIDVRRVCDGKADCDNQSDERNCSNISGTQSIFSSETEMIDSAAFRIAFWIIGIIVIIGNSFVIITTMKLLKKKNKDTLRYQQLIILNIAAADFIMGMYLLIISGYSLKYSGEYGTVDHEWRSSLTCSITGSLAIISSETSCFLMVVLTAFRLVNVKYPVKSLSASMMPWRISLIAPWLLSFFIGVVPILNVTSPYFVHSIFFSSNFFMGRIWDIDRLNQFVCRYASLNNSTIMMHDNELLTTVKFVETTFPSSAPVKMLGYYGETSICLPRFYVTHGYPSWEFTLALITVNLLCFFCIAICYLLVYKYSFERSEIFPENMTKDKSAKMQRRIARIIATDFCCWIPICTLAYIRFSGVKFSNIVYQISAVLLLPVNSAVNPFLFSSLIDNLIDLHHRSMCITKPKINFSKNSLGLSTAVTFNKDRGNLVFGESS